MFNFKAKDLIIYGGSIGIVFLIFLFLLSTNIIGYSVKEKCQVAQSKYQGDCVESLMAFLDDEDNDLRSRNSAIWALGQLGDDRAVSNLEKYYSGNIEKRGALDEQLSQLMLKRAINLASGGLNLTAPFWRFSVNMD